MSLIFNIIDWWGAKNKHDDDDDDDDDDIYLYNKLFY